MSRAKFKTAKRTDPLQAPRRYDQSWNMRDRKWEAHVHVEEATSIGDAYRMFFVKIPDGFGPDSQEAIGVAHDTIMK